MVCMGLLNKTRLDILVTASNELEVQRRLVVLKSDVILPVACFLYLGVADNITCKANDSLAYQNIRLLRRGEYDNVSPEILLHFN